MGEGTDHAKQQCLCCARLQVVKVRDHVTHPHGTPLSATGPRCLGHGAKLRRNSRCYENRSRPRGQDAARTCGEHASVLAQWLDQHGLATIDDIVVEQALLRVELIPPALEHEVTNREPRHVRDSLLHFPDRICCSHGNFLPLTIMSERQHERCRSRRRSGLLR